MAWENSVYSSHVQSIGWDEALGGMIVTWKSGKRSLYIGVTEELADEVSRAPSVGSMIGSEIKPNYEHRYL